MLNKITKTVKKNLHISSSTSFDDRASVSSTTDHAEDNSTDESFFDGNNYRRAIKRLDQGHSVMVDMRESMMDYRDHLHEVAQAKRKFSMSKKSKLKEQPIIASYHTTKLAQKLVIESAKKEAELIDERCSAIEKVSDELDAHINRLYIVGGLGRSSKHRRSDEFERKFENARSNVKRLQERMKILERQHKKAKTNLMDAKIQCENLRFASTQKADKIQQAEITERERQIDVEAVEKEITSVKEQIDKEQSIYRENATVIFRDCQSCERERLEIIREVLLKYIEAVHPASYSTALTGLYEKLQSSVTETQSSDKDLEFWADTHGVNLLMGALTATTASACTDASLGVAV